MPDYSINGIVLPPLGVLYLSSNLEHNDIYIKRFFDTAWINEKKDIYPAVLNELRYFNPDIVAISALTPAHEMLLKICSIVKKFNDNIKVIAGGAHVSVYGKELKHDNIDFLIKGEAEHSFSKLCYGIATDNIDRTIPGLIYSLNNEIFENPAADFIKDLDTIKFPDWSLIDFKKYKKYNGFSFIYKDKPIAPFITSRACPFNCTYCHRLFGQHFKQRSVENIIQEIELLYFEHGIREFQFVDDAFNLDLEHAKKVMKKIIHSKINISIAFPNGLIPIVDEEFLRLAKKAGTYYISYAPESASSRIRKFIKKCTDLEQVTDAIEKTVAAGIFTNGYFMIGFPTETIEEIQHTISYALNSNLHSACFFTVIPFPNTELAEITGLSDHCSIDELHYFNERSFNKNISADDLISIKKNAYKQFYISVSRAFHVIKVLPKRYLFGSGLYDIIKNLFHKLFLGHT